MNAQTKSDKFCGISCALPLANNPQGLKQSLNTYNVRAIRKLFKYFERKYIDFVILVDFREVQ